MLYYNTVNPLLKSILQTLMEAEEFSTFRLVGGTALSLQLGHRISIDIDLFSDVSYGNIDFEKMDRFLENTFPYVEHLSILPALGKSYRVGNSKMDYVKVDVFYTDEFISEYLTVDGIRIASIEEIIAMKMEVIQNIGRKKDFWDIHQLLDQYSIHEMIDLHERRYPYSHDRELIIKNLTNFSLADNEPDPNCLEGKYWELIKLDIEENIKRNLNNK